MSAAAALQVTEREAWLQERRTGIGGSDAAAVLGVSPWRSPYALWLEKTGLAIKPDEEEAEYMEWGRRLEPIIAEKFAEVTGREIAAGSGIVRHPRLPFMLGTLDFGQRCASRGDGVLEVKTLGFWKKDEWAEEPPLHYAVQLQHYLAVTGRRWGSFAALIGGQQFVWCDVERNEGFIEALEQECAAFWERVKSGQPPPVDGSKSTKEALKLLYPKDSGRVVELADEARAWHEAIETAKAEVKRWEAIQQEAENKLKEAIGDATEAFVPGGPRWTYKLQTRRETVQPACEFRVLRVKKESTKAKGRKR